MKNEIEILNGSLEKFLMSLVKILEEEKLQQLVIYQKNFQAVRFISNFNLPGKQI